MRRQLGNQRDRARGQQRACSPRAPRNRDHARADKINSVLLFLCPSLYLSASLVYSESLFFTTLGDSARARARKKEGAGADWFRDIF